MRNAVISLIFLFVVDADIFFFLYIVVVSMGPVETEFAVPCQR